MPNKNYFWYKHNPSLFLNETQSFCWQSVGIYIMLLDYQFKNGSIPNDVKKMATICRCPLRDFNKYWPEVSQNFTLNEDLNAYQNQRIIEELGNLLRVSEAASKSVKTRWEGQKLNNLDTNVLRTYYEGNTSKSKSNIKEINKEKFVSPTVDEVKAYAESRGFNGASTEVAKMFFDYYSAHNWKDSLDKPVKNWKQKFIMRESGNDYQKLKNCQKKENEINGYIYPDGITVEHVRRSYDRKVAVHDLYPDLCKGWIRIDGKHYKKT